MATKLNKEYTVSYTELGYAKVMTQKFNKLSDARSFGFKMWGLGIYKGLHNKSGVSLPLK